MKKKRKIFQSIRAKIIIMLLGISMIPVSIMGISSYMISKGVLNHKLETTSEQTIQEVGRGIDNYFSAMSNLVKVITQDVDIMAADNPISFGFAKRLLADVKDTDENILDVFVGTEKDMHYTYPEINVEKNTDFKSMDWYIDAMNHPGEVIITKPYTHETTGKRVVSIAKTIEKGEKIVGVAGMNIDLEMFSKSLSAIKLGNTGYIFIADSDGIIISHPDQTLIGTNDATTLSFWTEAAKDVQGFASFNYKGEERFGAYCTSNISGWKIMASMKQSELTDDVQVILNTFIIILVLISMIAISIALLFSKSIAKNIKCLLIALVQVSKGDFTAKVTIKSKDEFRQLGNHFNEMVSNVSGLIKSVQDSSDTVNKTSELLAVMAEETNASVNEVASAIEEMANGADKQAQNSVDGANSISELADKLNLVKEATDIINNLSKSASNLTDQGLVRVETLIQTSNETKNSTAKISELIYDMSESMNQINAISDTISNITAQTNLLALNASIEAARAGEAGKGFAVVADEIRNLAEQSKISTVQIKKILDEIQEKTESSVKAMEQTDKNVKEQEIDVNQTQSVFQDIMKEVSSLTKKITEIKYYTSDIAAKKEIIISQIENISAISEESASATEEVNASTVQITVTMDEVTKCAVELQYLTDNLQKELNGFKI